jgi:hypothetical protein
VATATSVATKDEEKMTVVRAVMAMNVAKREVDTEEESVVKNLEDMAAERGVKNKADTEEESVAKNLEVMAEANVARNLEATEEATAVKNMATAAKRAEAMEAASVVTKVADTVEMTAEMTGPAAATQEAVTIDARSHQDTVTDQAVDTAALQVMEETQTKSSDVQRLNATTAAQAVVTIDQVAVREDMAETTPTTVPQVAPVAQLTVAAMQVTEATRAPNQANSRLAHPMAVAMAALTISPALLSMLSRVAVTQAMPTSSAWLSVF